MLRLPCVAETLWCIGWINHDFTLFKQAAATTRTSSSVGGHSSTSP